MDGEVRLLNQIHDCFETPLVRNRESSVDAKAKLRKSNDVGEIEVFERVVVRDVEEDRLDAARSWQRALPFSGSPASRSSAGRFLARSRLRAP